MGITGTPPSCRRTSGQAPHPRGDEHPALERAPRHPAMAELPGFAGYNFTNWTGVFMAAKTPPR